MSNKTLAGIAAGVISLFLTLVGYNWATHVEDNKQIESRVDRVEQSLTGQAATLNEIREHLKVIEAMLRRRL